MPKRKSSGSLTLSELAGLGEPVALDDEHPERMEELEHVGAERRGTRDADAKAAAQLLLDLLEDEPVGHALLQREEGGHRPAGAPQAARPCPDAERPAADRPLQAAAALDLVEDAGVDLLVDARDRRQDGRAHGAERLADAGRLRDERHRRAGVRGRLVREPAEGVGERQEEQDHVAALVEMRVHAERGGDEVLVREHARLRRAGRSRGVDQRGEVLFADLA